jgi:dihydrofolate reductase
MKSKPEIIIIAAVAESNRVIGRELDLPWHIPQDLKRFKALTLGHPLLMGRKTFMSIVHQFGAPLPGRRHVILTSRGPLTEYPDVETFASVEEAFDALQGEEKVFIGGGGTVYEQFIDRADVLELTLVEGEFEGDTFFPPFEHLVGTVYDLVGEDPHDGFRFLTYRRQ